jgi:magnesium transporter
MLHALVHRPGEGVVRVSQLEEIQRAVAQPDNVLWVDFEGRSEASDTVLEEVFGFHPLAIEDVYRSDHRPKVEDYDRYLYIIAQELKTGDLNVDEPDYVEMDLFLGPNFVVTHHAESSTAAATARAAIVKTPEIMAQGATWVAHAILDRLVDRFLTLPPVYEQEVDRLEVQVLFGRSAQTVLGEILDLTRAMNQHRRMAVRQREVLKRLALAEFDEVAVAAKPFFRDVEEHAGEFVEGLDALREELAGVFNAFHSLASHRMNEIMKLLTLISTIMLPLTFLAGVYGMNFDNMPELHWAYGYYALWGVMAATTATMVLYFRYRRWL